MDQKICSKCNQLKPLTEFHRDSARPDGLRTWCKECATGHQKSYAEENREKLTKQHAEYVEQNRDKIREINQRSYSKHRAKWNEYDRERWEKRKDERNAQRRAERLEEPSKSREQSRRWREANPEIARESKAKYLATHRERMKVDLEYAAEYREKQNAVNRAYKARIRKEVIDAYGGKCFCCGEGNIYFLSLDHVNNDGCKHKKESGTKIAGDVLYLWARKNGYPATLRVACFNCNMARAFFNNGGDCPHTFTQAKPVDGIGESLLYL